MRLVQIQNAAQDSLLRLETSGECAENGQVELIQILLGRGDVYSDGYFELNGDGAGFNAGIGYLGQKRQTVDINFVMNHWGQKTNSEIGTAGALKHDAKKIFRGTIDFKKGSAGSVGNEQETVLMLGDGVANKTVPLILCAEETSWAITARPSASWTRTRCSISRAAASLRRKRKTSWPTPLLSVWPARLEMKRRRPRSSLSWRRCCKMAHEYRDDFPLLKSQDIAYLDNAATAQRPQCVLDAVTEFYKTENANPLRGLYPLSVAATESYENARKAVRPFLNAKRAARSSSPEIQPRASSWWLTATDFPM